MRLVLLLLVVLGLSISGYLLLRHFALADLSAQSGTDFCSALFGTSCDDALRSPLAVQLGLPLAGWGLVYYGTLASLLLLGWTVGETFRFEAITAALLLALGAALGSIALFIAMVTDLSPFCPMCAVVHAINLLLLFPLKRLTGRPVVQLVQAVAGAIRYLVGGKTADPVTTRWKLVGFLASGLVAVVIYQWVFVEYALHTRAAEAPFDPRQTIALFESGLQHEIPVSDSDPQLGPADAPVTMVVFNDFQCPGCKQLAQTIPGLASKFGDTLQIVFKHFPLDSVCNSLVKKELHPRACEAARAAEAAREQGKFWAFHEALFKPRSEGKMTLRLLVEHLGLNLDRFEAYSRGDTALAKVQADIDLGIRLGVDGTPSVFINGRRVYDTRGRALQFLIAHEVEHHNHTVGQDSS
ncbi:MAG TPA: vitamin K epoxide reductase family protein [Sedimentisphaerales bacterium]|nr:vitamin K epoxide reductase family protein [Sedimentisphaerales bacterium]